jgi:hypothetical protein
LFTADITKGFSLRFGFLQLIPGVIVFVTPAEETISNMFTSPRLGRLNSVYKTSRGGQIGRKHLYSATYYWKPNVTDGQKRKDGYTHNFVCAERLGPRSRLKYKVKRNQKNQLGLNWIDLAQDSDNWKAVLNMIIKLRVP